LAKSSVCPGIITIIWSLITSDTGGDEANGDSDPDDQLTELLNNQVTRDAVFQLMKKDKREGFAPQKSIRPEHFDLF